MQLPLMFDLVLGFGMSFFTAQGDTKAVSSLRKLQAAKASGANIDAHLQVVADQLIAGVTIDWDALDAAIDAEVDEFLSRGSGV